MKKLFLLSIAILSSYWTFSQTCGTPIPAQVAIYSDESNARGASSLFCIDVFFHIVRNNDGTNAFTAPNLDDIISNLNEFYSPHNIVINNAGSDFIDNSNFTNIGNDTEATNLGQTNNRFDAINYYIVETLWNTGNGGFIAGTANSIPSNNLVIREDFTLNSVSAHEFGHCLNLLHTFETANGIEAINGSNCQTAGDLICDTLADQNSGAVNGFNPDLTNIMSYYTPSDHFTNGQGSRMRSAISQESILQDVVGNNCVRVSEVNNVCPSEAITISLTSLDGATTTWTSSANVQIVSSTNSEATLLAQNRDSFGDGWVTATLSNGIILTEEFKVGLPNIEGYKIYNTSYNGNYIELRNIIWNYINIVRNNFTTHPNPLVYKWDVTADNSWIRANPSRLPRAIISPNSQNNQGVVVGIRAENECGCSEWKWQDFIIRGVGTGGSSGGVMEETEGN